MSGLLTSLQGVANALGAFSSALGAEQANVSNSSTPGYAAQRAVIEPLGLGAGIGFDHVDVQSTGSAQADALVQSASSQASESQTKAQQLTPVNQQFDITGSTGILAGLEQFSAAFANLAVTPGDPSIAATALTAAENVASAFNSVAVNLDSQTQSLGQSVQSAVSQINSAAAQIAGLNAQIRGSADFNAGADAARRSALTALSSLVGISVTGNADGTVNVLTSGSIPLVLGDRSYALNADLSQAPGSQVTSGGSAASQPLSGALGGLVDTYNDTFAPLIGGNGQAGSLNTLAAGFASSVNALLSSGVTASGAPGAPVFSYDPSNAARTLAVDPAVTATGLAVATTGAGAAANGVANQLAALAATSDPAHQIDGLSPQDYYASIAQGVGQQLSGATSQATLDQTGLTSAQANQTAAEGVSLDQEAVNITSYQRAWEASAKLIGVLDNLTLDSVNLVGEQET